MKELFAPETVSSDSPRLRWMKKHHLITYRSPHLTDEEEPWSCWDGRLELATGAMLQNMAEGITEDDAIANWALHNGVKLWNEEVA